MAPQHTPIAGSIKPWRVPTADRTAPQLRFGRLSGQSSCRRGVNFFGMWRVQRLDQINALKPANLFDFKSLTLKFRIEQIGRFKTALRPSDRCRNGAAGAVLSSERVQPPQRREAAEVLIRRCQQGSIFHGECGKDSVRYQRTGCAVVIYQLFQNFSMKWPRMHWNDAGLPQPFANDRKCFLCRSRIRPDS